VKPAAPRKRQINRGALPPHLPREEVVIDVADKTCACCGGRKHCIGEDVSERLDVIPAQFKVIVTHRPKYACAACAGEVVQAPARERLIENGIPTEALVAHVLVAKYADHTPLYRQAQIYARQGVTLDRSTLADWVGRAAFALVARQRHPACPTWLSPNPCRDRCGSVIHRDLAEVRARGPQCS
jgi:transposase